MAVIKSPAPAVRGAEVLRGADDPVILRSDVITMHSVTGGSVQGLRKRVPIGTVPPGKWTLDDFIVHTLVSGAATASVNLGVGTVGNPTKLIAGQSLFSGAGAGEAYSRGSRSQLSWVTGSKDVTGLGLLVATVSRKAVPTAAHASLSFVLEARLVRA